MSTHETKQYFDLHTTGIGYLNRIREVTPKEGQPFLSVTIAALRGRVDNAQYTHFECRVAGRQAQEIIRQVEPALQLLLDMELDPGLAGGEDVVDAQGGDAVDAGPGRVGEESPPAHPAGGRHFVEITIMDIHLTRRVRARRVVCEHTGRATAGPSRRT